MSRNPYEDFVLNSSEDYQYFASIVINRVVKVGKLATQKMFLNNVFNDLKDIITKDDIGRLEQNIKDLYMAKKQAQTEHNLVQVKPQKVAQIRESQLKGKKINMKGKINYEEEILPSSQSSDYEDDY